MRNYILLGFILALVLSGCSSGLSPSLSHSFDVASQELDEMLSEPATIAATVALIEERASSFPTSSFQILGSPEAHNTGLRNINFSRFDVALDGEDLHISYLLLPSQEDPTERIGELTVHPATEDLVTAKLLLTRTVDPDHGGDELDITRDDQLAVRRLSGNLRIDFADTCDQERPYTITFTPSPGHRFNAPRQIREGYQITIGE